METLFSTRGVHPQRRFDYWHDVACRSIVRHDSRPQRRECFQAEMQAGRLAEIEIVLFETSPMAVTRTARQVAAARNDDLFVCRQMAASLTLEQEGRELVLDAGDMTLLDPMLPYRGNFGAGSKLLVLKVPRRLLEVRIGKARDMVARLMTPVGGEAAITSAYLAALCAHSGQLSSVAAEMARDQALDLIALSLAKTVNDHRPRLSSASRLLVLKLHAAIEAGLNEAALDAGSVAAAAGISVRYANALLAKEGTSIARAIWTRRLARCRRTFEDPSQRHRTVSEIAYGWGFSDMTHFGRRFKQAYGMLPSEYRRIQGAASAQSGNISKG